MITLPRPLRGIVPPVLTPLSDRDTLDVDAYSRLLEHQIAAGCSALFILGSTGESPSLSHRLRRELIDHAVAVVKDRVPLLVGISDTAFVETLSLAEYAARAGATALVLAPPFYYALSQQAFLGYLSRLTAELPLPLYLYNMPGYTKLMVEPETVRAAAELPMIYGLKDSSGNRDYVHQVKQIMSDKPDFAVLVGIEEILAEMVVKEGVHGGVCGGANLHPRLYVDIFEAASNGDMQTVERLQKTVLDISASVYRVGDPGSAYLRGLKCATALAGFGNGMMAEPYWALREDEREQIRKSLVRLGLC